MLFKKNEKKAELKRAIKAKQIEIAKFKKENREWIDQFMKETDPEIAMALVVCIRVQAKRISSMEAELNMMNEQYKTM